MFQCGGLSSTAPGFRAGLLHPDFGNEVVAGSIFIHRHGFRFESPRRSEEIPVDRITVEVQEAAGRICFYDCARPGLCIHTQDQRVFTVPGFPQLQAVRDQLGQERGRREVVRSLRLTAYFVIGFLVIGWIFSRTTGAMVRSLAAQAPPGWEKEFGAAALEHLAEKSDLDRYTNQVAELTALAAPLLQNLALGSNSVRFHLVTDEEPNAFALPGGDVLVNTGLLELTDRPEELLGVLAHELAHVAKRHYAQKLVSSSGSFAVFGIFLGGRTDLARVFTSGSGLLLQQGFSREYETEADDAGWDYLVAARIDPRGMITFFQKIQQYEQKMAQAPRLPQSFQSHPALAQRIARLEARWRKRKSTAEFIPLTNALPKLPKP